MKTCKTCKYWSVDFKGVCDFVGVKANGLKTEFYIDYHVDDDSGLEVYLHTGPDFSCHHYLQKGRKQ